MKPKNVILVRHGQSIGNVDKSVYSKIPDYALTLTKKGKEQAIEAGERIKRIVGNDKIKFYVSPFWRTRQTLQGIAKSFPEKRLEVYEDPRLREQEWNGSLPEEGFSDESEIERDLYGHFYYRFAGGESCADTFDRVSDFLNTLFRDFEKDDFPESCVIVTHGMTLRVLLMRWLKLSVEEFELLANPYNCELVILSYDEYTKKYKLVTQLNEHEIKHSYQFNPDDFDKI